MAKETPKKKPVTMDDIGGKLPPPPTKAELDAMSKRGTVAQPGSQKAKPAPKAEAPKTLKDRMTGINARKKMLDEFKKGK
jgi:hypothetical protein